MPDANGPDSSGTSLPAWFRQFGSSGHDEATSLTVDQGGNIYVAGNTAGALSGQVHVSISDDGFIQKYDASGTLVWTRQFGTKSGSDFAGIQVLAVSADALGNVFVAGDVVGALEGQTSAGGADAFVQKYDATGTLLWSRQFGTDTIDFARGLSVDASGSVYVVGNVFGGVLPGQTGLGGGDAYVLKYNASGTLLWTHQFGTDKNDNAKAVSAGTNAVFVYGNTSGTLAGQTSSGSQDVFLQKYDLAGTLLWTRQFGSSSVDSPGSVSVDASGNIFVVGSTTGAFPGQANAGGTDAFVQKYDAAGTLAWTRQFGTDKYNTARSVSVDASGNAFVLWHTAELQGLQPVIGGDDVVVKFDAAGTSGWTRPVGTSPNGEASSVGLDGSGNVFVAGYTTGTVVGQTSAGGNDAFVMHLVP